MTIDDLIESINVFDPKKFVDIDFKKPVPKMPYQVQAIAREITSGIKDHKVKAYALHNWVTDNIEYNVVANENFHEKSAIEYTLKKKAGTCYSMTRTFVAMAKSIGLDARIARVFIDRDNRDVPPPGHVCAMVDFIKDHLYFDPAYKDGDAKHKKVEYFSREDTNLELIDDIIKPYKEVFKIFEEKNNYKSAFECCNRVLKIFPDNESFKMKKVDVLKTAGKINIDKKLYSNAVSLYNEALKLNPDNKYCQDMARYAREKATA